MNEDVIKFVLFVLVILAFLVGLITITYNLLLI